MIFEAGPITFLRTILIIVLVYYVVKYLIKLFLPFWVKKFMQKQQEKFQGSQANNFDTSSTQSKRESTDKKDTLGEYVDYEELD